MRLTDFIFEEILHYILFVTTNPNEPFIKRPDRLLLGIECRVLQGRYDFDGLVKLNYVRLSNKATHAILYQLATESIKLFLTSERLIWFSICNVILQTMVITEKMDTLSLLDLPSEVLRMIAQAVYLEGAERAKCLFALSLSCKTLRQIITPVLFHSMTVDLTHSRHVDETPHFDRDLCFLQEAEQHVLKHVTRFRIFHCRKCSVFPESPPECHIGAYLERVVDKMDKLSMIW